MTATNALPNRTITEFKRDIPACLHIKLGAKALDSCLIGVCLMFLEFRNWRFLHLLSPKTERFPLACNTKWRGLLAVHWQCSIGSIIAIPFAIHLWSFCPESANSCYHWAWLILYVMCSDPRSPPALSAHARPVPEFFRCQQCGWNR